MLLHVHCINEEYVYMYHAYAIFGHAYVIPEHFILSEMGMYTLYQLAIFTYCDAPFDPQISLCFYYIPAKAEMHI